LARHGLRHFSRAEFGHCCLGYERPPALFEPCRIIDQHTRRLDVGGSATEEAVSEAFRIILSDNRVKGVLVNIFGGIMQCDRIARAIVGAAKSVGFKVPLVVRLEGTNVAEARRILDAAKAELPTMQAAGDLGDAARRIVAATKA
jgi:succinyl-CoA synthetase beta subunit